MGQPPRPATVERAHQVYGIIVDAPGVTVYDVSKGLGVFPSIIQNSLITMEQESLYVSEDVGGRLYTFEYGGLNGL